MKAMVKSESLEGRWCFKHAILWINQEYNTGLIMYIQVACFYDLILFFLLQYLDIPIYIILSNKCKFLFLHT